MKTVNFLEALEANKTKRVRLKKYDDEQYWGIGELRKQTINGLETEVIEECWVIEPTVFSFSCVWKGNGNGIIYPDPFTYPHLNSVLNKKCKVTVEITED